MVKVLALTVKPLLAPDTRYLILQYIEPFARRGITVDHRSLFGDRLHRLFQQPGGVPLKMLCYSAAWVGRAVEIARSARGYDAVWISRELSPIGPPLLERLLLGMHKKVVLDIDDAIFLPDEATTSFIHHRLRDFGKFEATAGSYAAIICGNSFLADYFTRFSNRVHVIPTVVSMARYGAVEHRPSSAIRIGWIGMPSNAPHIDMLEKPLRSLRKAMGVQAIIVGVTEKRPWDDGGLQYVPWELARELDYFADFDIGVMPLRDFAFAHGKCAFKIIQFMAAGVPVVASPVGANAEVIRDGENGMLAASDTEWETKLGMLAADSRLRRTMGREGRRTVADGYSLEKWVDLYAAIFKS